MQPGSSGASASDGRSGVLIVFSQPCTVHINYNRVGGLSVYMWIIYVIMIMYICICIYI